MIDLAVEMGADCAAWTVKIGVKLVDQCECLRVPSTETARIQECHILVGHVLCELVGQRYFKEKGGLKNNKLRVQ